MEQFIFPKGCVFNSLEDIKDKHITVMGLGLNGGGEACVKFFLKHGAYVIATDMKTQEQLKPTIDSISHDTSLDFSKLTYVLGEHRIEDFKNADCEMIYEFTKGKYESLDCFATASTGQKFAIELKNRDISLDKYDTYLLELHKYNALMIAYEESGYTPLFRVYFQDGVLTWDISKIDISGRVEEMSCAESIFNYDQKRIKKIIMLKKEEAIDKKRSGKYNC